MTAIKSYTSLEQSQKLAEILPMESADRYYAGHQSIINPKEWEYGDTPKIRGKYISFDNKRIFYPCWSLAALFSVLRIFTTPTAFSVKVSAPSLIKIENGYKLTYIGDYIPMINNGLDIETPIESIADNPIDACVNMILKLHEQNLL